MNWLKSEEDPSLIEFKIGKKRVLSSDNFASLQFKIDGADCSLAVVLEKVIEIKPNNQ